MTVLHLADAAHAADLVAYLGRLRRYEPGVAVRLRARGDVLGVFARPPFGVVALRAVPLRDAADLDVTVGAPDLVQALADAHEAVEVSVPAAVSPSEWPSSLPPPTGWVRLGAVDAGVLRESVRQAVTEFRRHVDPVTAGPGRGSRGGPGEALAARLWDRPLPPPLAGLPLRSAHAAQALGFLADGDVVGHGHTAWTRLDAPYGSIAVRRTPALPLQPVTGG